MHLFQKLSTFKQSIRFFSKEILDAENLFLIPKINNILNDLIDRDPLKVHSGGLRKRENPNIQLLSNEQTNELREKNFILTKQKLQMPPVKNARKDNIEILEKNEGLNRFLPVGHKIVFVDINIQDKNRHRLMSVREADGVLRTVSWTERDRFNQVYFPLPGREIIPPPMFNEENLITIMNEGRYMYILDRNCIQFEPDDPLYISICNRVYEHVNNNDDKLKGFRQLSTTRHFGGLVLYLMMVNNIGNILLHLVSSERLKAVNNLLELYTLVYPQSKFTSFLKDSLDIDVCVKVERFLEDSVITEKQKKQITFLIGCLRESKNMKKQNCE